jgi:membrane protease YdiL (CAAX protease family)
MLSEKPWRLDAVLVLGLRIFLCLFAGAALDQLARHAIGADAYERWGLHTFIATLTLQGAALVWVALFLREHGTGWTEAFGLKNNRPVAVGLGVLVAVAVVPGAWVLQYFSADLLTLLHLKVEEQLPVQFLRDAHSAGKIIYLGFATILLAPVAEELLFRGILYPLVKRAGHPRLALWGVSVLFASIHADLAAFVPLLFFAMMVTLLYEWTNNLLACIVVHSLFNAANFAAFFILKNSGQLPGN